MPHIKTNAKYYTQKRFVIYVIVSPVDSKIYVGKTQKHVVKNHYTSHYNLRNKCTKDLFEEAKNQSLVPKMYLLEELDTVEVEAYQHCVAWTKYFIDHDFISVAPKTTNEYARDLLSNTKIIYEQIKNLPIEEVICETRILIENVRGYRPHTDKKSNEDETFIGFRVSQKEADKIRNAAEKKQRTVSEYCRTAAVDGCVINVDFNFLWRYMRELMGVKSLLQELISTIYETGKYEPQDLVNVQKMVETVISHEKKMNDEMIEIMKKTQKKIRGAKRDLM